MPQRRTIRRRDAYVHSPLAGFVQPYHPEVARSFHTWLVGGVVGNFPFPENLARRVVFPNTKQELFLLP